MIHVLPGPGFSSTSPDTISKRLETKEKKSHIMKSTVSSKAVDLPERYPYILSRSIIVVAIISRCRCSSSLRLSLSFSFCVQVKVSRLLIIPRGIAADNVIFQAPTAALHCSIETGARHSAAPHAESITKSKSSC